MKESGYDAGNMALTGSAGTAMTTSAIGFVGWINTYAVLIGLSVSIISLLIGLYFHIHTMRWRTRMESEERAKLHAQIVAELSARDIRPNNDQLPHI